MATIFLASYSYLSIVTTIKALYSTPHYGFPP
jgi:hypothetical protein